MISSCWSIVSLKSSVKSPLPVASARAAKVALATLPALELTSLITVEMDRR